MVAPINAATKSVFDSGEREEEESAEAALRLTAASHLIGDQPSLAAFFTAFTRYAAPEDLVQFSAPALAALVKLAFETSQHRLPGSPLIECLSPPFNNPDLNNTAKTVVLSVTDDMPFLYDSVTAAARSNGASIAAAFHPIVPTFRDTQGMRSDGGLALNESVVVLILDSTLDAGGADTLRHALARVLSDVRSTVKDWKPMLTRLAETIAGLKQNPPPISDTELSETLAFLGWLADNHFTFLGSRDYVFSPEGDGHLDPILHSGLGILSDPERRVLRRGTDRSSLTPELREFLTKPAPLIITKTSFRSEVHRRVHMDYIGVKTFDARGNLTGERRFVGLFTSAAYAQSPTEIPLLRRKVNEVLAGSGLPAASHDGKALAHIVHTFPRDELFQIGEDELLVTALGILNLGQRPKVRVFLRFDKFDRFVSALVYLPRERYSGASRDRIHAILARTFDGRQSAAQPMLDDEALARIHYIVGRNPGPRPEVDGRALETEIKAAIRTWEDGFADALARAQSVGIAHAKHFAAAFPASYRDDFSPAEAVDDAGRIQSALQGKTKNRGLQIHVYAAEYEDKGALRLKLFVPGDFIPLSQCLPVFENLGLKVIAEDAYALSPTTGKPEGEPVALQNFAMARADGRSADLIRIKPLLEDAFHAVWAGDAESDGFNRLVVAAELGWRDIVVLRAVGKFLRQAGVPYSQPYMENALAKNPLIAVKLAALFHALHDPHAFSDAQSRTQAADGLRADIEALLKEVPSADDDRICRLMLDVVNAMLRVSFYQKNADSGAKSFLAFKLQSGQLDILPLPRPLYEIFVYSPEVEGIHLRFGKVARGGIRWSDRAEDFRTEILSLVKAQQVKNAVIVPVGAKGGFFAKRVKEGDNRDAVQATGISAYKTFIGALLDLTDNLGPEGNVIPPANVLRHDADDPYLVVAADKGTATFSDIANDIALERGFWLGDAFASGGSQGYDHKKMAITARGAWEAVKRHFRELGRDIQTTPFTCIGVGDMSGDVFGNAMLLSRETKVIAAFDHRHIFIDPAPDAHASWDERKRLFDLPRSSWADYDASLISKGGGIFSRSAKEIPLSLEMQLMTGIIKERATPAEVIHRLLLVETDLLFFGGIGTFVKSSAQANSDAGDRVNDAVRVNGRELRALVVGEGANLGMTQAGRIEYATSGGHDHKGGRLNTDAIDNSAGVDTSDHEVNIKILMSGALRRGELSGTERLSLLNFMTEDVARLVLKDNYDQTLALSVAEASAVQDLDAAARFMRELEKSDKLDREVEGLPSDEPLKLLARDGKGLTRPELAVLLAYAKLDLFSAVIASDLPRDVYFHALLSSYFPPLAAEHFKDDLFRHRLAGEIIATQIVNRMVNLAGPLFAHRVRELTNVDLAVTAKAFVLANGVFELETLAARIAGLDLKVAASVQTEMMGNIAQLLRRLGPWFAAQDSDERIGETIETYHSGFLSLKSQFADLVSPWEAKAVEERVSHFTSAGVPADIAEDVGMFRWLASVPEIVLLAHAQNLPATAAAKSYFAVGGLIGLDRLRARSWKITTLDHWDRLALRRIVDDLYSAQRLLAADALKRDAGDIDAWSKRRGMEIERMRAFLGELEQGGEPSIAKLALANSQIQKLAIS